MQSLEVKMYAYLLLFCFSLISSVGASELNVMTINTEWLWTPHDHLVDGRRYNKGDMSAKAYNEEIRFYSAVIKKQSVNLLAVSEIENEVVANDLAKAFGPEWKAYFKQGRDTATGQDVAIISKLDPVIGSLTDFGFPSGQLPGLFDKKKRLSKVVGVQFWLSSHNGIKKNKVGVITAHFLSKRKDNLKKSKNRQRQAYALVKVMDEFVKDVDHLIVLGDFNDFIDSKTLSTLMTKYALQSAAPPVNNSHSWRIDHILFRQFKQKEFKIIDLMKYSDHDAIFVSLKH